MRVLALPRYGPLGASSRLRTYQYLPAMEADGIEVDVHPLLSDRYVHSIYEGRRYIGAGGGYLERIARLAGARNYDAVWTEKELLPWLSARVELHLLPKHVPLAVDYDDALFHRYDKHSSRVVRGLLGTKIDRIMRRADLVIAGNEYLAERAWTAGCKWVEQIPTVVDLMRYPKPEPPAPPYRRPIVVGWIGSPSTAGYLNQVAKPMAALSASGLIRCVAIGARPSQLENSPFTAVPWQEDTEVAELQKLDVGIMPLPDAPWERGKCGYKLIQYMACGLPVVASPVGANIQLVSHGQNGLLASTGGAWAEAIEALALDPDMRQSMGDRGRAIVEQHYCLQVQAPRLRSLFKTLVQKAA